MSHLQDLISACPDTKSCRTLLEKMGMHEYIAMSAERNKPYWGEFVDSDGITRLGFEINPNAIEYHYEDLSEEEINKAVEILCYG